MFYVCDPTCHDGADEEEHTEEDVAGLCAEVIDDFALNDGEHDSKYLDTTQISEHGHCLDSVIKII